MPVRGSTNLQLRTLIRFLRKASSMYKASIWKYVAELLEKPRRQRIAVNLGKINRLVNDGDQVVVPGKVLAAGIIDKKITIAAWRFSKSAIEKALRSGCEVVTIPELVRRNPKGSNVKIVV